MYRVNKKLNDCHKSELDQNMTHQCIPGKFEFLLFKGYNVEWF